MQEGYHITELRFETMKVRGTDLGEESCVPDLLGEHILQNHLDEEDDIREGEDSVAQLWSDLHERLCGHKDPVPYRYDFKAS